MVELSFIQLYLIIGVAVSISSHLVEYLSYTYKEAVEVEFPAWFTIAISILIALLWPVWTIYTIFLATAKSADISKIRNNIKKD